MDNWVEKKKASGAVRRARKKERKAEEDKIAAEAKPNPLGNSLQEVTYGFGPSRYVFQNLHIYQMIANCNLCSHLNPLAQPFKMQDSLDTVSRFRQERQTAHAGPDLRGQGDYEEEFRNLSPELQRLLRQPNTSTQAGVYPTTVGRNANRQTQDQRAKVDIVKEPYWHN